MATTERTFSFLVHGTGVPNADCGSYPNITISFKVVFDRADGSQTVSWRTEGMSWNKDAQGSGKFGYPYHIYILVNGSSSGEILEKTDTSATTNWEDKVYTHDVNGTFISPLTTTNVAIYARGSAGGGGCYHASGKKPCYTGNTTIQGVSCVCLYDVGGVGIPVYEETYTVSYNANGGSNAPASQTKSSLRDLELTTDVPIYPINVVYHNDTSTTKTWNKTFINWNTSANGTGTSYSPGGLYRNNADCTLYAQWGSAPFRVDVALPQKYYTLIFDPNGGVVTKASTLVERSRLGYNTSSSATTATYIVGNSYSTNGNLDLYPIYGSCSINVSSFPKPTREGFIFKGWYRDKATTQQITGTFTFNADNTKVYAGWTALPIHIYQNNGTWSSEGPYVWIYKSGQGWVKQAPLYKYDGSNWINISE